MNSSIYDFTSRITSIFIIFHLSNFSQQRYVTHWQHAREKLKYFQSGNKFQIFDEVFGKEVYFCSGFQGEKSRRENILQARFVTGVRTRLSSVITGGSFHVKHPFTL